MTSTEERAAARPVLSQLGISLALPPGWSARIYQRSEGQAHAHPVLHAATFALPTRLGDFGSGATPRMGASDALVVLLEYGRDCVGRALFRPVTALPRPAAQEFSPSQLQRTLAGQCGCQRFVSWQDRAFCLYIVLGSHARRAALVPRVHDLLAQVSVVRAGQP